MKKYKEKLCIYCGKIATTKDHTPSKCLLEQPYPNNLFTVDCCQECNVSYSLDEQYFVVLLSHISTNPILKNKIKNGGVVSKALERSPLLDTRILNSISVDSEGRLILSPETTRIHNIIRKNALGLYFRRYKKIPFIDTLENVSTYLCDEVPISIFITTYDQKFQRKKWNKIQKNIFEYIFVRHQKDFSKIWCIMNMYHTLWGIVEFSDPKSNMTRSPKQYWLDFHQNLPD